MLLRPRRMDKIRIIGSDSVRERVVSALHDYGVMQLEPVSMDLRDLLSAGKTDEKYRKIQDLLQKFRGYENALPPIPVRERRSFHGLDDLFAAADRISEAIEPEIWVLKREEEDLESDLKLIESRLEIAKSLSLFPYDLGILNGDHIISFLVRNITEEDLTPLLRAEVKDAAVVYSGSDGVVVSIPRELESGIGRLASSAKLEIVQIPQMQGRVNEYIPELEMKLKETMSRFADLRLDLRKIAESHYVEIAQVREQLEIEFSRAEITERLASTKSVFVMEGWVPSDLIDRLSSKIDELARGRAVITRVSTDETPPTMLFNPRRIRLFEFFIRFYSLPQETEFDPTLIFALVFPVFFGLMVGDVGYGLIILLVALWLNHRLAHPPRVSHIPKKISGFVGMIMGPSALRTLARALIPGSIVAIFFGILFNEFFGFPVPFISGLLPYTVHGPVVIIYLPHLLVISGFIGLGMVTLGLILGFIDEYDHRNFKGATGKLGWIMIAWGVSLFGLDMLHNNITVISYLFVVLALAGVAVIMFAEGSHGAMELPSIVSHILSYTRIVGILLASVILAYVVDSVFESSTSSIGLMIFGGVILVLGQLFNLAIAVFEPGIQGARLIYVEFFSKFYRGNGKPFVPFSSSRKYTVKQYELQDLRR